MNGSRTNRALVLSGILGILGLACNPGPDAAAQAGAADQHRQAVSDAVAQAALLNATAKAAEADAAERHREAVDRAQATFDAADDAVFAFGVADDEFAASLAEAKANGDDGMVAALKAAKAARASGHNGTRAAEATGAAAHDAAQALRAAIDARDAAKAAALAEPRARACTVLAEVGIADCAGALAAIEADPSWRPKEVP